MQSDIELEDLSWGLLEALQHGQPSSADDEILSIHKALTTDLDGSAFGSGRLPQIAEEDVDIPHFPSLSQAMLNGNGDVSKATRTSEPISRGIKHQQAEQYNGLVGRETFDKLLAEPIGKQRFQEWVEEEGLGGSSQAWSSYVDLSAYRQLISEVEAVTKGLRSLYNAPSPPPPSRSPTSLPPDGISSALPDLSTAALSSQSAQTRILDHLYATEFKRFIRGRLTEQARSRMGAYADVKDRGDLAEVFCIANPRLPDQPIVFVSDAFCRLSEYPRDRLVGRNCRFLQGPKTDRNTVRLLRDAIKEGREHSSLLLNYTRTGKPFWNLLNLIPMKNAKGQVDFFIGAQVDVSRALEDRQMFEALTKNGVQKEETSGFAFSDALWQKVEYDLGGPSRLRKVDPPEPASPPTIPAATTPPQLSRWRNTLITRRSSEMLRPTDSQSSQLSQPMSRAESIPDMVKEHMVAFASAYSRLFVINPQSRHIEFVSPALLAYLDYPIRSITDRCRPALLNTDLLEILHGKTPNDTAILRSLIKEIISSDRSHSAFATITSARRSGAAENAWHYNNLLHWTPVKAGDGFVHMYLVVVG